MATKIKIYFTLFGQNFDPEDITKYLDITPNKIWRKGNSRTKVKSNLFYDDNGWCISTENISLSLSNEINKILKIIYPKLNSIINVAKDLNLEAELACKIIVSEGEFPEMHFEESLLKNISELNCEFDIDILG